MKTPLKIFILLFLLPATLPAQENDFTARIICIGKEPPVQYAKRADGMFDIAPPAPGTMPPETLFFKTGKPTAGTDARNEFSPFAIGLNNLSEFKPDFSDKEKQPTAPLAFYLKKKTTADAADDKAPENYVKFFDIPKKENQRSSLTIIYKNGASRTWTPVRTMHLDTSKTAFHENNLFVFNTASAPATVTVGRKQTTVPAGQTRFLSLTPEERKHLPLRIEIKTPDARSRQLVNTVKTAPAGERALVLIYGLTPEQDAVRRADFVFLTLPPDK